LWTDGRTYGRTDGHFSPSNNIRSTFGSRPKKRSEATQTQRVGCGKADPQTNTQTGAITVQLSAQCNYC